MEYTYTVIVSRGQEEGYIVQVPALPGCVTEGDTVQEALEMAREAIECHLESFLQHGEAVPEEGPALTFEPEGLTEGFFFRVTAKPEILTYA